jgi:hypothetical protein
MTHGSLFSGIGGGLSSRLDSITFSKWRNESIKAAGNAIVPQVVYQIFKAIKGVNEEIELPADATAVDAAAAIMEGARILTDAFFKAVTPPEATTEATLIKM